MLSETQLGYLAGILDGEGAISITRNKRRDKQARRRDVALRCDVRVSQRRKLLLDTICAWIGEENASISRTGLGNRYFSLRFKHSWLREHLPKILPYLLLKQRQAEIVISFLAQPSRVGRNGVGEEEWERRILLYEECKGLNLDRTNALT